MFFFRNLKNVLAKNCGLYGKNVLAQFGISRDPQKDRAIKKPVGGGRRWWKVKDVLLRSSFTLMTSHISRDV